MNCQLTPYGTYPTNELCTATEKCGFKWRCAREGDKDAEGKPAVPGTPVFVADGTFNSAGECLCYTCDVDTDAETATCTPTDGEQGDHASCDTCNYGYECEEDTRVWVQGGSYGNDQTCVYVADGAGGRRLATPQEVADGVETASYADVRGFSCISGDTPQLTSSGGLGHVDSASSECRYECKGGQKRYKQLGGKYNDLYCYTCDGGEEYTPVDGPGGEYAGDEGGCQYWCDPDGSGDVVALPRNVRDANTKPTKAEVKCVKCSGGAGAGPGSSCKVISSGVGGSFDTMTECDMDSDAKCGWGYGCVDNACALSESAPRGRSKDDCDMDSDAKCGWKYGCFNKFVPVGETCVGVPEDECATRQCFNSEGECVSRSPVACDPAVHNMFPGSWRAFRVGRNWTRDLMFNPSIDANPLVFAYANTDADGYSWFNSDRVFGGIPLVTIGVRDVTEDGVRNIYAKFKGRSQWNEAGTSSVLWWSRNGVETSTYNNPSAVLLASWDASDREYGKCHTFEQLDMQNLCDSAGACLVRVGGNNPNTPSVGGMGKFMLQRVDVCGEAGYNVATSPTGHVDTLDCQCIGDASGGGEQACV